MLSEFKQDKELNNLFDANLLEDAKDTTLTRPRVTSKDRQRKKDLDNSPEGWQSSVGPYLNMEGLGLSGSILAPPT